ncbi:hypothetical protein [uncultured Desulfobacter sp.]|uniref:hypothetical protein n=1 Tax=uncultured Desulfobacter sp. TaxID=240139 RepID=UPI0029F49B24|nr:hypothetical protein [uncultured Desulfobacter sp.]
MYTNQLFKLSESRGKEASGIAFWDRGDIDVLKVPQPVSKFLKNEQYKDILRRYAKKKIYCAIGHSRLVTDGESMEHSNNQPVIVNDIVGVHNGIIVNHDDIWEKILTIERESALDSEIIFQLYNLFLSKKKGSLFEAVSKTYKQIEGVASTATIINSLNTIVLATNNGSLYYCLSPDLFVFVSEKYMLEKFLTDNKLTENKNIQQLESDHVQFIDISTLETIGFSLSNNVGDEHTCNDSFCPTHQKPGKIRDVLRPGSKLEKDLKSKRNTQTKIVLSFSDIAKFDLLYQKMTEAQSKLKRCTKCVLPETMPFIRFDANGVCSYCHSHKKIEFQGRQALLSDLSSKKNNNYDCILGVSGGRDSTFALHYIKREMGLNPVVFTYDWGMVTDLARRNVSRICAKLGVEHILISADIKKKRKNIKKNVVAWLKKPNLGMVPLFMAGDKQYFLHAQQLRKQMKIQNLVLGENMLERTDFKTGFAGVSPFFDQKHVYSLSFEKKMYLASFYLKQYLFNPFYINSSIIDSLVALFSYYYINRSYLNFYHYIPWDERNIIDILQSEYNWEIAKDTKSTWRIGDGTSAFYNYIYLTIAGFNEFDTFRSNQIREGLLTRGEATHLLETDHLPRYETIEQYLKTIEINMPLGKVLAIINTAPKLYSV